MRTSSLKHVSLLGLLGVLLTGSVGNLHAANAAPSSLREASQGLFPIGLGLADRVASQPENWALLTNQFSIVTPENCMKPAKVQASEGQWDFALADSFVNFSSEQKLNMVGHCLVWAKDDRTPEWFFRDGTQPASRERLLDRMRKHVETVVNRYKGRIVMWDVVNEALDDGTNYLRSSGWERACGEEFLFKAFEYAHQADPQATLIYNDYNNELPAKREKMLRLIRAMKARAVPLHAVGLQGHYELDSIPFDEIEATIVAVKALGLKIVVSELDIDVIPRGRWWADGGRYREELSKVDPYRDGCPPDILQRQADQYARLFAIFRRHHDVVARVSFWNLHDGQSWLNTFPWKRVNHPLLFDRLGNPKPAFGAVMKALQRGD
jgi:endo-1,4-beta-xylanase